MDPAPSASGPTEPTVVVSTDNTMSGLVAGVTHRFLQELSMLAPSVKASAPSRLSFPCHTSQDLASVIIRRIPSLLPDDMVLLEAGVFYSPRNPATFHVAVRRCTQAELALSELLPSCRNRLGKHLGFKHDVQQLAWSVRHVEALEWDMFDKKSRKEDGDAEETTEAAEAPADTDDDSDNDNGSRKPVEVREHEVVSEAVPVTTLAQKLAGYHVALAFHSIMSNLYSVRGYEDYYPPLPPLSEDVLARVSEDPAAADTIQRYESLGDHLGATILLDKDVDKERAYVYMSFDAEDGGQEEGTEAIPDSTKEGRSVAIVLA